MRRVASLILTLPENKSRCLGLPLDLSRCLPKSAVALISGVLPHVASKPDYVASGCQNTSRRGLLLPSERTWLPRAWLRFTRFLSREKIKQSQITPLSRPRKTPNNIILTGNFEPVSGANSHARGPVLVSRTNHHFVDYPLNPNRHQNRSRYGWW